MQKPRDRFAGKAHRAGQAPAPATARATAAATAAVPTKRRPFAWALILAFAILAAATSALPFCQAVAAQDEDELVAGDMTAEFFTTTGEGLLGYGMTAESAFGAATNPAASEASAAKGDTASAKDAKNAAASKDSAQDAAKTARSLPSGWTWPFPVVPSPGTQKFVELIGEDAREIAQGSGLYASVMIAQAILESGSGGSGLSQPPLNNLFGIKGSYRGKSVYLPTSEDDGTGRKYDIMAGFRRYPSWKASMQDYADLLTEQMGRFYAPVWKANARTYVQACNYLQGHYATDTTYSGKLQGLILAYDLTRYDHPADAAGQAQAGREKAQLSLMAMGADADLPDMKQVEVEFEDDAAASRASGSQVAAADGDSAEGPSDRADAAEGRARVIVPTVGFAVLSLLGGLLAGCVSGGAFGGLGGLGGFGSAGRIASLGRTADAGGFSGLGDRPR